MVRAEFIGIADPRTKAGIGIDDPDKPAIYCMHGAVGGVTFLGPVWFGQVRRCGIAGCQRMLAFGNAALPLMNGNLGHGVINVARRHE